ncbi:MAG: SMI1/KNR4 family protein [Clostridiales bacterium]|nr:SMI1/KNR4 family protein [Clostridiales bacterium]
MSEYTWKYIKKLKDENLVKEFLKNNRIALPDSLIMILENKNGGRPSNKMMTSKNDTTYILKSLLSYNDDDPETIYMVYTEKFREKNLLPIGTDPSGNILCYNYNRDVYALWLHESNEIIQVVVAIMEN